MRSNIDLLGSGAPGAELMLDARPAARFRGEAPEPRPRTRAGHIPRSRSVPFSSVLQPDGRFLDPPALRAVLAAAGVKEGGGRVTLSCGSGVTAAVLHAALLVAGLRADEDLAIYDGSWSEWGLEDSGNPVATGSD